MFSPDRRCFRVDVGNVKRARTAWRSSSSSAIFTHSWADGGTSEEASGQTSSSSRRGGGGDVAADAGSVAAGAAADGRSQSDSATRENALRRCLRMREAAAKAGEEDGGGKEKEAGMEDMAGISDSALCGMIFGKGAIRACTRWGPWGDCFISVLQRRPEIIKPC